MNRPSVGSYHSRGKRKVRTKKKKGTINANVTGTKYEIGTVFLINASEITGTTTIHKNVQFKIKEWV